MPVKTGSFRKYQFMTSHIQFEYHMTPNFTADSLEQIFQNVFFLNSWVESTENTNFIIKFRVLIIVNQQ